VSDYMGSSASTSRSLDSQWEQTLIRELTTAAMVEQRRARRWGIFFKFTFMVYLAVITLLYLPWSSLPSSGSEKHTALIDLDGVISASSQASADRMTEGLRNAFEDENTAGVILRINSPGGSPVQSGYIYDEVRRLREIHPDVPLYAVITDICASGGYYVAAAADQIYADKASIVGSIGVISNGFGFVKSLERLGVERRLIAAGENKGFMDPFSPLKPDEVAHFRSVIKDIHEQFIGSVEAGRGERLNAQENLYGGLIWSGERSLELGLVDALGSASYVAREVVGEELLVDFTPHRAALDKLAERIGVQITNAVLETGLWPATSIR